VARLAAPLLPSEKKEEEEEERKIKVEQVLLHRCTP